MIIFIRLSLFTIVTIFARLGTTEAIVPECTFTGTSGFCAGMAGRFIRPEYNPNIRALYIVNCDLTALTSDDFARFQSLSTLHINNSTLPLTTYQHLLSDLKELKDLQITHSNLSDNIKLIFVNNIGLNNLSLQGNKITQIRKDTFSHLTQLETIDVSNNDISEVDQDSFVNLKHLKKFVLSKNKIEDNEKADHLWQAFEEKYDILFLEDNPICSTLGTDARSQEATDTDAAAGQSGAGCDLVPGDECQKQEARRVFFNTACTQSGATRRRSSRNHGDDLPDSAPEVEDGGDAGDLPDSAPEVEDGGDAGDLPDSPPQEEDQHDPPAAGASGEAEAEGGGRRDPDADGEDESAVEEGPSSTVDGDRDAATDNVDDNDYNGAAGDDVAADDAPAEGESDGLPLSSVEVEEVQVDGLSQYSSRSVLLGAIGGVGAGIGVGAALVVFFRTKRSYRSIQQNDEDPEKIELKVIKNNELPEREEDTPLTRIPIQ